MLAVILAATMAMPALAQSQVDLTEIATRLDMTSFRNSIGPRRQDGLATPADYGFTEVTEEDGTVSLTEADQSWLFAVRLLDDAEPLTVCITDRAMNGGNYFTVNAYQLTPAGDLYTVGEALPERPDCK